MLAFVDSGGCDLFQTVLLVWEERHESPRARQLACELAGRYDAELVTGVLVPAGAERPAPALAAVAEDVRADVQVAVPYRHVARDVAAFAHEHGYDLLVLGHHPPERTHRVFTHDIARELVDLADIPVLVVAEADFVDGA